MSSYKISVENIYPAIRIVKKWIKTLAETVLCYEGVSKADITIILVDDQYITRLNQQFFKKDDTTDVISFNLADDASNQLEGEVYANIEQIKRQAKIYQVLFQNELHRILIHGILHLVGYNDQTAREKKIMTEKEDNYLKILHR